MRAGHGFLWSLALLLAGAPAGAVDREVDRLLADGRRLYSEMQYPAVVQAMRRALDVPGIGPVDQLEAYEYMGCAYVALQDETSARRAFRDLLVIDPYYVLREPSGSPKIREVFERARHEIAPDAALEPSLSLRISAPRRANAGEPAEVRAEPSGPVARMTLRTRVAGELPYARSPMTRSGRFFRGVVTLPERTRSYSLEFYLEARNGRGGLIARGASPLAPRSIDVRVATVQTPNEWWQSPWVWVGAGAVVVGSVVLGVVLATSGDDDVCGTLAPCRWQLSLERP